MGTCRAQVWASTATRITPGKRTYRYPYPRIATQVYKLGRAARWGGQDLHSFGLVWAGRCAHVVIVVSVPLPLMQAIGFSHSPGATCVQVDFAPRSPRPLPLCTPASVVHTSGSRAGHPPTLVPHYAPDLTTLLVLSCCRELSSYPCPYPYHRLGPAHACPSYHPISSRSPRRRTSAFALHLCLVGTSPRSQS